LGIAAVRRKLTGLSLRSRRRFVDHQGGTWMAKARRLGAQADCGGAV